MTIEARARKAAYQKAYDARPEVKARNAASKKARYTRPEVQARRSAYLSSRGARAKQRECFKRYQKKYPGRHKELVLLADRKRAYGTTRESLDAMVSDQLGSCKICSRHFHSGGRFCVDHCHKTGKVRGLLCIPCNNALGFFGDSVQRLRAAITYLTAARN